jgi:hypothetical protein
MITRIVLAASLFLMAALAGCGGTGPMIGGSGDFWKEYDRTRGGGGGDGAAG